MKVAIVHEWLVTRAGSEKVVEEILGLYPEADLFTLICALPPGQDAMIRGPQGHDLLPAEPLGRADAAPAVHAADAARHRAIRPVGL